MTFITTSWSNNSNAAVLELESLQQLPTSPIKVRPFQTSSRSQELLDRRN